MSTKSIKEAPSLVLALCLPCTLKREGPGTFVCTCSHSTNQSAGCQFNLTEKIFMVSEVGNVQKTFQALVQDELGGLDCLWHVYAFIHFISTREKRNRILK